MSGVTLAFESKAPHTTPWLSVEFPVGEEPVSLLTDLSNIGWYEREYPRTPPLDGWQEVCLQGPRGSGLFKAWTEEEARQHMPAVRRFLRREGFDRIPWNRLELAELI